jgi:glycyl-tRNA synthetase beta chain
MADARVRYRGSEAEKKFSNAAYTESVRSFFRERLEFYLKALYPYDVVNAVLAADADDVVDAVERARALSEARTSRWAEDLEAVCISFRRIKNILKQAEEKQISIPESPDEKLMDGIERELWYAGAQNLGKRAHHWQESRVHTLALSHTAALRPMLDKFFDEVMVMVDDEKVRANRLALLRGLYHGFSTIADFSEIVTEGKS